MGQLNPGNYHSSLLNCSFFILFSIFYTTGSPWERYQGEGTVAITPRRVADVTTGTVVMS